MDKHTPKPKCDIPNPYNFEKIQPKEVASKTSQAKKLYTKLVKCEARLELLRHLQRRRVGTVDVEGFLRKMYAKQGGWDNCKVDPRIGRDGILRVII